MSQFISDDQVKANITYTQMFKSLWPYMKRHPYKLFLSLFCILAVAASSRLMPTIIGYAIDHGIKLNNLEILKYAAIAFLVTEIAHSFFLFAYQYLFQWYGNRMLFYIREDLISHVQKLPIEYFNKTPTGRIVTRINNDMSNLNQVFTDGVINVFTESVVILSLIVSMLLISVKLTIATLILTPLFVGGSIWITGRIRQILRDSKKSLALLNSFTSENLNGIKVVQLFGRVKRSQIRFQSLSDQYKRDLIHSINHYAFLQPIMNLFVAVTITVTLYYGGVLNHEGALALGSLVAFLMHVQDFVHPLREILDKYQQFQNSLTSAERIFQILEEKTENYSVPKNHLPQLDGDISIQNLTFRYEDHLPLVLNNINIEIKSRKSLAIVGRTGCGKTTFISLLQRFYVAPENTIFINGTPVENIPLELLRSRIGVVQQDNFIFRGSLRENINLLDSNIKEEKILKALHQVGYMKLLERSGRNLDSIIEEKGANLSVGERQLIAFARILVFEPDILILDEATSNIDSESEKLIQKATAEVTKSRTSLIIAHRLSTIKECDQIMVLDKGQIIELGTHQELMSKKGYYYQVAETGSDLTSIVS